MHTSGNGGGEGIITGPLLAPDLQRTDHVYHEYEFSTTHSPVSGCEHDCCTDIRVWNYRQAIRCPYSKLEARVGQYTLNLQKRGRIEVNRCKPFSSLGIV